MKIPLIYNLRSLKERPVSTATTAAGMALVVAVFVAMMALSNGFRAALASTGSDENVLMLRKGARAEMNSGLSRESANIIAAMPFVAQDENGRPLVSAETFVVITLERTVGGLANVVIRGVSEQALKVRKGIEIVKGRMFRPGATEVMVGRTMAARFPNTGIADKITFGGRDWTVVGHFTADGSSFESEVWGENEQMMPIFRGEIFQSITIRLADPSAFAGVKQTLEEDPRLSVDALQERQFYESQSVLLHQILNFIAIFVAGVMAIGAVFGAINTMYAAVSSRSSEIAVLLTLGFKPFDVLSSFMAEAIMIALLGGVIGCLMVLPINGLITSTTNWASFSEVAFAFRITPALLLNGLLFATAMGLIGGFFPARRAAKQAVVDAMRNV
ncbi:MAG: ABC transporter permease [Gemmatimonadetes bacterium]|nr:ABC transporter permease [Gemmatimonadota bacterium]